MVASPPAGAGERTSIVTARFQLFSPLGLVALVGLIPSLAGAQASRPAPASRSAADAGKAAASQPSADAKKPASPQSAPGAAAPQTSGPRPGLIVTPDDPIGPPGAVDRLALDAVNAMLNAHGGPQALDAVKALRFTFEVSVNDTVRSSRTHWWDRRTNRYRIEGKNREGQATVTLFNVDTKSGDAWVDGAKAGDEDAAKLLESAYARFINDTYWFLMPFKLFDPGVRLQMDGEADVAGRACDRIRVTFDGVGLTPGDTYWAYIDRASHEMVRWGFILQGARAENPEPEESLYDWTDWKDYGPIRLAGTRTRVGSGGTVIRFPNIEVVDAFDARTFADPAPLAP